MAANVSAALSAYNQVSRAVATSAAEFGGENIKTQEAGGPSFASFLEIGARNALEAVQNGEQLSKMGLAGKADVRDVVLAVNNAEVTLQTVVAVRDKVVSAYSEIMKMAI